MKALKNEKVYPISEPLPPPEKKTEPAIVRLRFINSVYFNATENTHLDCQRDRCSLTWWMSGSRVIGVQASSLRGTVRIPLSNIKGVELASVA